MATIRRGESPTCFRTGYMAPTGIRIASGRRSFGSYPSLLRGRFSRMLKHRPSSFAPMIDAFVEFFFCTFVRQVAAAVSARESHRGKVPRRANLHPEHRAQA
jgi:hypothetical protein